jgi:hypothetical protein
LLGVLRTASSPEAIAMGQQPEVRQMLEEYYCVLRYKEESEQQKIKQ